MATVALALALWLGAANPPVVGLLPIDDATLFVPNPLPAPPYTLRVTRSDADSWGVSLGALDLVFAVDADGYISTGAALDWRGFVHARPFPAANTLYLYVDAERQAVVRVNDEIAWSGMIPAEVTTWQALRLP